MDDDEVDDCSMGHGDEEKTTLEVDGDTLDDEIEYFVDEDGNLVDTHVVHGSEQAAVNAVVESDRTQFVDKEDVKENIDKNVEKKEDFLKQPKEASLGTDDSADDKKTVRRKTVWMCDACKTSFDKKKLFTEHNRTVHQGELMYACTLCEKSFQSQQGLECHQESRHPKEPEKRFECPEDGCVYESHSRGKLRILS